MFDLEPGPIDYEDMPLGPRVTGGSQFGSMAADYVDARSGTDGAIAQITTDIAGDGVPDMEGAYSVQVGPAEDVQDTNANDPTPSPAGDFAANGEDVNVRAGEVADNLPPADAGVPLDFADPPSVQLGDYAQPTPPPPTYQNPDNPSEDTQTN